MGRRSFTNSFFRRKKQSVDQAADCFLNGLSAVVGTVSVLILVVVVGIVVVCVAFGLVCLVCLVLVLVFHCMISL